MTSKKAAPFTFIIRASGEATINHLKNQLSKQISVGDTLKVIDDHVSFEKKLKLGYDLAIGINNGFSVFIDGDILLRSNAVKRIRQISGQLDDIDFGFGLKLWDRFYNQPKFRGLHIYQTQLLKKAKTFIPEKGEQLRPESYVKSMMKADGHRWRNDFSFYVAGLHDYFQKPEDIYYKFLVRAKRSVHDIEELKALFQSEPSNKDYNIALMGLEDGQQLKEVLNDKYAYNFEDLDLGQATGMLNKDQKTIDYLIIKKLAKYYKFNAMFWKSI